jgi:hypothetical protein
VTTDPLKPANLGDRGTALWSALVKSDASIERKIVAGDACRLADRLDNYDRALRGEGTEEMTATALAGLNSEARLTAATLQRILIGLGESTGGAGTGDAPTADGETPTGSIHDEVAARRAKR